MENIDADPTEIIVVMDLCAILAVMFGFEPNPILLVAALLANVFYFCWLIKE